MAHGRFGRRFRVMLLCVLATLALGCGSGPYASFRVETTVHPDGSCDRTIWQPKGTSLETQALQAAVAAGKLPNIARPQHEFLPDEALTPEWNARWTTVTDASGAPREPGSNSAQDNFQYFIARGTFSSPGQIPAHYRYGNMNCPEAGASELLRHYTRVDYGFVVEHRWQEKITNALTTTAFLAARDEFLDLVIPPCLDEFEKEYSKDYDVSGLASFIRTDGRRFLEEASLVFYERCTGQDPVFGNDGRLDPELETRLATMARRVGLDFFDAKGKVISDSEEAKRRVKAFCGRLLTQYVKHRDGRAVSAHEAEALIQALETTDRRAAKALERAGKKVEERLKQDRELDKRLRMAAVRAFGFYPPFTFPLLSELPRYEFTLRLPGALIETNGIGTEGGRTRWKFTTGELNPDGYEMKARSISIDRDGQRRVLGREVLFDEDTAFEFMEVVGSEGPVDRSGSHDEPDRRSPGIDELEDPQFRRRCPRVQASQNAVRQTARRRSAMRIVHALTIIAGCALGLVAYRALTPRLNARYRPLGQVYGLVMGTVAGPLFAAGVVLARRRLRGDSTVMSQPGHWLVVLGLAAVLANAAAIAAYYGWYLAVSPAEAASRPPHWVPFHVAWAPSMPEMIHQAVGWGLGAIASVALCWAIWRRVRWYWWLIFLAITVGSMILAAGHITACFFVWGRTATITWCIRAAHLYGKMIAVCLTLLVIAVVCDARQGRRYDALHWTGIATWLVIALMQLATYFMVMFGPMPLDDYIRLLFTPMP